MKRRLQISTVKKEVRNKNMMNETKNKMISRLLEWNFKVYKRTLFQLWSYTFTIAGLMRNLAPAFMALLASLAFKTVPTWKIPRSFKAIPISLLMTWGKRIFEKIKELEHSDHSIEHCQDRMCVRTSKASSDICVMPLPEVLLSIFAEKIERY